MEKIEALTANQIKKTPDIKPGDTVRVHTKIIEGNKERIQVFEGVVIRTKGSGTRQTFTVRKLSYGIGVERTFLINSPKIARIEVKKRANVRRAYLTYLRGLRGKAAKLKDQKFDVLATNVAEEELKPEDLAPAQPEEGDSELDAELTEINVEEAAEEVETAEEVSTEDIAKAESREADAEDVITEGDVETDHQVDSEIETEAGLEKAEHDLEKGKSEEGAEVEKQPEEIKEEKPDEE
jgi:large subunit ribosomal protein L19